MSENWKAIRKSLGFRKSVLQVSLCYKGLASLVERRDFLVGGASCLFLLSSP